MHGQTEELTLESIMAPMSLDKWRHQQQINSH